MIFSVRKHICRDLQPEKCVFGGIFRVEWQEIARNIHEIDKNPEGDRGQDCGRGCGIFCPLLYQTYGWTNENVPESVSNFPAIFGHKCPKCYQSFAASGRDFVLKSIKARPVFSGVLYIPEYNLIRST